MATPEKRSAQLSSLMASVAAIVEAALQADTGHAVTLLPPAPSPWKQAHRRKMALDQTWHTLSRGQP